MKVFYFDKNFGDNVEGSRKKKKRPSAGEVFGWFDPLTVQPKILGERLPENLRPWQLFPFYLVSLFVLFVFFARLFDLQIVKGERNFALSEENRIRIETILPERGVILDRNGQLLGRNRPGFKVLLKKGVEPTAADLAKLGQALSLNVGEIRRRIENKLNDLPEGVVLKKGVSQDEVFKIETSGELSTLAFVTVDPVREYLYPRPFAHVLGFVGEISREELEEKKRRGYVLGEKTGKSGLEAAYDDYLKGRVGKRLLETDARGRILRETAKVEARAGFTLKTNLSRLLQRKAFEFLEAAVLEAGGSGGAAVGQNPKTGEILFLVSVPSFDPNLFSKGLSAADYERLVADPGKPLFNRGLMAAYPPGSVFKLVTGAAALEEGVVAGETVVDDRGFIAVGSFVYRGWKEGGHGPITFADALAKSCDIYFYTVGGGYGAQPGVGVEKLAFWAREFGLGARGEIDLPGEAAGLVPDEGWKRRVKGEPWYIGNTYHFAIGQGDLTATPLQINVLTAAVANGGRLMRPYVAKEIVNSSGERILSLAPTVVREGFVSPQTIKLVKEGMRRAVLPGGTGYPMRGFRFESGGKTGTAEFGGEGRTHAWFTVFTPFDDPEIVVTVLIEGGGEGSHQAAPVARKILDVWAEGRRNEQP